MIKKVQYSSDVLSQLPNIDWKKTVAEYLTAVRQDKRDSCQPLAIAYAIAAMAVSGMSRAEIVSQFQEKYDGWPSQYLRFFGVDPVIWPYFDRSRPDGNRLNLEDLRMIYAMKRDQHPRAAERFLEMHREYFAKRHR